MTDVTDALNRIEAAAEAVGLPELARSAEVPYSTAAELRSRNWRPKSVQTLEKLSEAAARALEQRAAAAPI